MDPVVIGGVGGGTFVFLVLMLAFLLKFARKGKRETATIYGKRLKYATCVATYGRNLIAASGQVVIRVPRVFNQGKYMELATDEDFHCYERNQYARHELPAKYLHEHRKGIPKPGTYKTKDPASISSRFMSKKEKRKRKSDEAYKIKGENRVVHFRNVEKGISSYEPGYQMTAAVDRVITRNLVGKTKLSSNEPHAECIGHNNSPVGKQGVCRTRVFQSPSKSYTNEVNEQFPKSYRLQLSYDHRLPQKVYVESATRHAHDGRRRDRMNKNAEQQILKQVPFEKHFESAEPYENINELFVRPHETGQSKRERPRDTSQRVSARSHNIHHTISGISHHYSQQPMQLSHDIRQPISAGRHNKSQTTSAWSHDRKQNLGRRSVKDIVEEVKRESQQRRKSQVETNDPLDSSITPKTVGRNEPSFTYVPDIGTPSIVWKSRNVLKPEKIDETLLVKQEEQFPRSRPLDVYNAETDEIMVDKSSPPLSPSELQSQLPEAEFPSLPSFLMNSDATTPILTDIVSSQEVLPRYTQNNRQGEISQYAKLASPVQLTSPVKQAIKRPSLKVSPTNVTNDKERKQALRESINDRSHSIVKSKPELTSRQSIYPQPNRSELSRYMGQVPGSEQATSAVLVNERTRSRHVKVNEMETMLPSKSKKLNSTKVERTRSQIPKTKAINNKKIESPRKRKLLNAADQDAIRSPSPDTDITDYVKELLQSFSNEAVQQRVFRSKPQSSKSKESTPIYPPEKNINHINQVASIGSDVNELVFSPQQTSTPIQSSTDVQEQIRTNQSVIKSALQKRRLRIANSSATFWGESSATVIPDASNTFHDVFAPEQKPVHKTCISTFHKGRSSTVHSAPPSPTWLTEPIYEQKEYQASHSAPSSPTSHGKNTVSLPRQSQTATTVTNIHLLSGTNQAGQTEASDLPKLSPRELLLQQIRSRRTTDED